MERNEKYQLGCVFGVFGRVAFKQFQFIRNNIEQNNKEKAFNYNRYNLLFQHIMREECLYVCLSFVLISSLEYHIPITRLWFIVNGI